MTKKDLVAELAATYELDAGELKTKTVKELEAMKKNLEAEQEGVVAPEDNEDIQPELIGENGEELLFPGGPSINMLEEWKSQYNDEVYLTEFDEDVFLWRPIKRKEYKDTMKVQGADSFYKEEKICETVVLWPQNYNFMEMRSGKAGIPTVLAEYVMEKSGFQTKTGAVRL